MDDLELYNRLFRLEGAIVADLSISNAHNKWLRLNCLIKSDELQDMLNELQGKNFKPEVSDE